MAEWEKIPEKETYWTRQEIELESHAFIDCNCGHEVRVADEGRTQCEKCGQVYRVVLLRWVEHLKNFPKDLPEQRQKRTDMWPAPPPTEMPKVRYHI